MTLLVGDCVELMAAMPAASVDAVVTDPPYELGFMGKSWDRAGVSFQPATWAEGFAFTGCEQDADYAKIAEARIAWWAEYGEEALAIVKAEEQAEAEREKVEAAGQLGLFG